MVSIDIGIPSANEQRAYQNLYEYHNEPWKYPQQRRQVSQIPESIVYTELV